MRLRAGEAVVAGEGRGGGEEQQRAEEHHLVQAWCMRLQPGYMRLQPGYMRLQLGYMRLQPGGRTISPRTDNTPTQKVSPHVRGAPRRNLRR